MTLTDDQIAAALTVGPLSVPYRSRPEREQHRQLFLRVGRKHGLLVNTRSDGKALKAWVSG